MGNGSARAAAHDAIAIVLPAPGGPLTSVSGPCAPALIRSSIRGRETRQGGKPGTAILEAMSVSSGLVTRSREELVALDAIAVPSLSPTNYPGHRTCPPTRVHDRSAHPCQLLSGKGELSTVLGSSGRIS